MKEIYFTEENIDYKVKKMIDKIESGKTKKLRKNINITDSALIIIDMQRYFTSPLSHAFVPSVEPVIGKIKKLIGIFVSRNSPVIFTRHIDDLKNKDNMLLKWWRDKILESDSLSELDERLYSEKFTVVIKSSYDSFHKTELESILEKNKIKKIFIAGVVSNLCCETTARSGFIRGYEIYFGVDTTCAYSFSHHLSSVINIAYGFGVPFILEDLK